MISLTSPVKTRAHHWPAGVKLAALCCITFWLFFVESLLVHVGVLICVLALYALWGRVFFMVGVKRLWVLWPFVLVLCLWHIIEASYVQGAVIVLRFISVVGAANFVTMTTRLTDMIEVIRFLCTPLRRLGFQMQALEIAIALVIRMTPVFLAKGNALFMAWKARSWRRVHWRIILPFTLLVFDDADNVADALKARGGIVVKKEI